MSGTTPIRERMPTIAEMQAGAEEVMRNCMALHGQSVDEAIVRRQAAKMVRAIRPRVREVWGAR
jgi:hypothetical protein